MRMLIRCWDSHLIDDYAAFGFQSINQTERGVHDRIAITAWYIQPGSVSNGNDQLV